MEIGNFTHTCVIPDVCFYGENDKRVFIGMVLSKGNLINAITTAEDADEAREALAKTFNVGVVDVISCEALIEFIQQLRIVIETPFYLINPLGKRRVN